MYRWFLTLPLVLLPVVTAAATFDVSAGGSIAQALSRMGSGDTLTIHGGTYEENNLQPSSGSTVQGAPGERVVLRPSGNTAPGFDLGTATNITIRNLTIDGSGGGISYGIRMDGQSNLVENVDIANVQNQGIAIYCAGGNAHNGCGHGGNTLRNVHVHGSGSGGCHGTTAKDGYCHGVYVYSDDNVIDGGEFDHNNGWGIQLYGSNETVTNVTVHENVSGGMTVPGSVNASNSLFTNNQGAGVWSQYGDSRYDSLTLTGNGGPGLYFQAGTSSRSVAVNIRAEGNSPNVQNDTGASVTPGGSGASLVPGQPSAGLPVPALPTAPTPLPAPTQLRAMVRP